MSILSIIGVPGSGKSSLAKAMSVREGLTLFPEPVESNPYLTDYYADPARYAFNMQVFLLHERYKQTLKALECKTKVIMDASMHVNDIFSIMQRKSGIMSETDFLTYKTLSQTLRLQAAEPGLVVYLKCRPETAVQRIMKRGRKSEFQAPLSYWYDINETYDEWFAEYTLAKKIEIPVDDLDFVADDSDEDFIIDTILEYWQ
ncbi:Deoxyadenosine/deoxycytidine kinase [compost metagenome]